jgi:hypothetical protein
MAYGAVMSGAPRFAPSSRNCTLATATLSEALAVTLTVPARLALAAGEVIDTVGAVVSVVLFVVKAASPLMDSTPLEFFERTR